MIVLPCSVHAQSAFTAAGGDASGQEGSVSFSIGQIGYQYLPGTNGSVSEGVQQSYADMMVSTEYEDFISGVTMYPNPVSDVFTIAVSEDIVSPTTDQLSYIIRDLPGRMVTQGPMTDHRTDIQLGHLHQGVYLVTIYFKSSKVTSSRIIKAD